MEKINFQDLPSTSTPLNSTNLNQMQDNMEDAIIPIKLVTISDTAPSTATTGDMYYNTTDNKVYTAIATNTWDSGSTPRYDGFYINTSDNTLFYYNGSTLIGVGGSGSGIGGDTLPVGMIMPSASQGSITDWLLCDGSAVSRIEYSELFNAIGTTYGSGNGSTTFNLPNISGKMIIGYDADDTDFDSLGATGGSKTHTQTVNEMPSHTHTIPNSYLDNRTDASTRQTGTGPYISGAGNTTNSAGRGQPMDIMNPYIVMNYYIKAHQTAPVTATVKNEKTTSETDVYSCNYVNNVDDKFNYSSNEQIVGKWIDGKILYRKTITFDYFPNDGQRNVAHYITNLQYICWYAYSWYDSSDAKFFSNVRFDNSTTYCKIAISNTYLIVEGRGTNWSARTSDGTCIIYYTKTTD